MQGNAEFVPLSTHHGVGPAVGLRLAMWIKTVARLLIIVSRKFLNTS